MIIAFVLNVAIYSNKTLYLQNKKEQINKQK